MRVYRPLNDLRFCINCISHDNRTDIQHILFPVECIILLYYIIIGTYTAILWLLKVSL